jgi:hypothetical protein
MDEWLKRGMDRPRQSGTPVRVGGIMSVVKPV